MVERWWTLLARGPDALQALAEIPPKALRSGCPRLSYPLTHPETGHSKVTV